MFCTLSPSLCLTTERKFINFAHNFFQEGNKNSNEPSEFHVTLHKHEFESCRLGNILILKSYNWFMLATGKVQIVLTS